jgi:hypothetical protein
MKNWADPRAGLDTSKRKFAVPYGIEPQFSGRPASSIVTTPTEPEQLSELMKKKIMSDQSCIKKELNESSKNWEEQG